MESLVGLIGGAQLGFPWVQLDQSQLTCREGSGKERARAKATAPRSPATTRHICMRIVIRACDGRQRLRRAARGRMLATRPTTQLARTSATNAPSMSCHARGAHAESPR